MVKTKRKQFYSLTAMIMALAIVIAGPLSASAKADASSGDSSSVLTSETYVKKYLREKYDDDDAVITAGTKKVLNTQNYSQTQLNTYYKNATGTAVSGTCSEVATTSLIEFYKELESFTTNSSYKDTFVDILTMALEKGYYAVGEGTTQTKLDSLVTQSFALYGSSHKGNNDYTYLYSTICDKVADEGVPVLFSIVNHTMVGCGYITYTTTYTTSSGKTKTATDNFVIVNDGWANTSTRQYSYFPEDEISTNVFTRWEFCITKVK